MVDSPMREKKSENISIRFEGTQLRQVVGVSERHGLTKSEWIRSVVINALAREAEERSEEHTSELQSPKDLVCRLLLEKKKNQKEKNKEREKNGTNEVEERAKWKR